MTTNPTKAEIEKVVRKVLQEEHGTSEATLKAVQRVSKLLTTQVIPRLPEESDEAGERGGEAPEAEEVTHLPVPQEPEPPEVPEEGQGPPTQGVPAAVTAAFEELYKNLSAEQAKALGDLFTAVSDELGEGGDIGPTLPLTDELMKLAEHKPAEFQDAIDRLGEYVVEEDDGSLRLAAPNKVLRNVDEEVCDALVNSFKKTGRNARGAASRASEPPVRIPLGVRNAGRTR